MTTDNTQWSIEWWKKRHDNVYFPVMEWHLDWKVCPYPPPHVVGLLRPEPNHVVLEIGCGYGEWMVPLHIATGCWVCGVDIHPILEEKANEIFEKYRVPNCEYRMGDGTSIPYPSAYFDSVYSVSVFQHMPRATVQNYFVETDRVLKVGGWVLFHFRHANGIGEYSADIMVDHTGDFSVGWTVEQAREATAKVGWEIDRLFSTPDGSLFLLAQKLE